MGKKRPFDEWASSEGDGILSLTRNEVEGRIILEKKKIDTRIRFFTQKGDENWLSQ